MKEWTKEQEDELREMMKLLVERGYSIKQILSAVSHQLRIVKEAERDNSLLRKRQPPAVKAGNYDV